MSVTHSETPVVSKYKLIIDRNVINFKLNFIGFRLGLMT